jgi:hypothetical protein
MTQLNFHAVNNTPPYLCKIPIVIPKEKEAYKYFLSLQKNFPKTERYGLGQKINQTFLEILELTFTASCLPPDQKIIMLSRTISRLDILKFFTQLAWENKLIPMEKYAELAQKIEEIGRMLGGWKKGLESKTPAR